MRLSWINSMILPRSKCFDKNRVGCTSDDVRRHQAVKTAKMMNEMNGRQVPSSSSVFTTETDINTGTSVNVGQQSIQPIHFLLANVVVDSEKLSRNLCVDCHQVVLTLPTCGCILTRCSTHHLFVRSTCPGALVESR
jgi:hypothetical protein